MAAVLVGVGYSYGVTLWDWAELLIVPAAIAAAGLWFNAQQRERELQASDQVARIDREIADQRRQDDMLQAYLDQMGALLLDRDRPLRESEEGDEVRILAQARTKTVLSQLDGRRKTELIVFLLDAGLVRERIGENLEPRRRPIINFHEADLRGINLPRYGLDGINMTAADLRGVDLRASEFVGTSLSGANLDGAILVDADLAGVNLTGASLRGAELAGADLYKTELSSADLTNADLSGADVTGANMRWATLVGTNLTGVVFYTEEPSAHFDPGEARLDSADMRNANLTGAKILPEQLGQVRSSERVTMPDGSVHP